ncbi:carboxylesterase family protein [Cereibacter sphaeroides]|nr:carboxylesterase family protein [Cereibacter sphaeroides]
MSEDHAPTADPIAEFPSGAARGRREAGLHVYRGLRYALPPEGPRRWQPPVPAPDQPGVLDATEFGPACPQSFRRPGSVYEVEIPNRQEDCLNLNIWAPDGAKDLPVFVWIHGGNLLRGAGSEPLTNGAELAKRGQVVVTINYRLGILGYLAHPELSAESAEGVSGNYGLLDQIAALEWVQRNIAAVGGDPANVTVAGESAGALSVYYLLCAPAAKGLFKRAIAQSGHICAAQHLSEDQYGMGTGHASGEAILQALGAGSIAELRERDAQELAVEAVAKGFAAQAVIDGITLPAQPADMMRDGRSHDVPLLAGFNSGEILTLEFLCPPVPESAEAYEAAIRARYGDRAGAFLARYPATDLKRSLETAASDALFGWTAMAAVKAQVANGRCAYLYYFDHGYLEADDKGLHGFHACEIAYVFDTMADAPPAWPKAPDTEAERDLTRVIGDYWTSFARDGRPCSEGAPDWPDYRDGEPVLHFADRPQRVRDFMPGLYDYVEGEFTHRRALGTVPWNWQVGTATPLPKEEP